jgi:phosphoglucomutase
MSNTVETPSAGAAANRSSLSPLAGKPAPKEMLVDVARLERDYFERHPDPQDANQLVSFGTSGHRGSPARHVHGSAHLAITQAIYVTARETDGPLYMKEYPRASAPHRTALRS